MPTGKKKVAVGKKAGGKKNAKKKSKITFQKDDGDFEIDPRLGGSKIKDAVNKKGKDKKLKPRNCHRALRIKCTGI